MPFRWPAGEAGPSGGGDKRRILLYADRGFHGGLTVFKRVYLAFLLLALTISLLPACAKPTVRLSFEQGSSDKYRVTIDTTGAMRVRNRYQTAFETHQILDLEQQVLTSPTPGQYQLRVTFTRVQMGSEVGGRQAIRADTGHITDSAPVYERALTALLNKPIILDIGPDGLVKKVTGMDAIVASIKLMLARTPGTPTEYSAMLANYYGEDFIRNLFESFTTSFPPASVQATTWRRNRVLFDPNLGRRLKFTQNCRLTNPGEKIAEIDFDGSILPGAQDAQPETRLPQSGMTVILMQGAVKGSVSFDLSASRLEKLEQQVTYLYGFGGEAQPLPTQKIMQQILMERQ